MSLLHFLESRLIYIQRGEVFWHSESSREERENSNCIETEENGVLYCGDLLWDISATRTKRLIGGFSFG